MTEAMSLINEEESLSIDYSSPLPVEAVRSLRLFPLESVYERIQCTDGSAIIVRDGYWYYGVHEEKIEEAAKLNWPIFNDEKIDSRFHAEAIIRFMPIPHGDTHDHKWHYPYSRH